MTEWNRPDNRSSSIFLQLPCVTWKWQRACVSLRPQPRYQLTKTRTRGRIHTLLGLQFEEKKARGGKECIAGQQAGDIVRWHKHCSHFIPFPLRNNELTLPHTAVILVWPVETGRSCQVPGTCRHLKVIVRRSHRSSKKNTPKNPHPPHRWLNCQSETGFWPRHCNSCNHSACATPIELLRHVSLWSHGRDRSLCRSSEAKCVESS